MGGGDVVMADKQSQNIWVLRQLKAGKKLSSRNAVLAYGIQDLPKRISELRHSGYKIESVRVYSRKPDGRYTHWNNYWMARE